MEEKTFYERMLELKQQLKTLEGKPLILHIDHCDLELRIGFEAGPLFRFWTIDTTPDLNIEEYNQQGYEELYIEDDDSTIENLCISLFENEFCGSSDPTILKDEEDEEIEYENVLFVIRTNTVDFIFTDDY